MTKGLFLKILGLTTVVAGLVFTTQLAGSTATVMRTEAPAAAPSVATRDPAPMGPAGRPRLAALGEGGPNFVSVCRFSHTNQDDPIVFPTVPRATHHHDFFANTTTNANSTYESLQAGGSTCRIDGDTAAYWAPALWANGQRVKPTLARIYYLPGRKDHATVRPFPAGLKMLATGSNVRVTWNCVGRDQRTQNQAAPPTCAEGTHLVQHIRFADCWDGRNLDTADHTSHMAFARRGGCPESHPAPMPAIAFNIHYPTRGGTVVLGFPDKPVAAHADFFNAWDQVTLERLVRTCINAGVHCGANPPGSRANM